MSTLAMRRSTSPRMSAAFQLDRGAPRRGSTRSATASRLTPSDRDGTALRPRSQGCEVELVQLADTALLELRAVLGTTLSGRAFAQARRSQIRPSVGPDSWSGCSVRHCWCSRRRPRVLRALGLGDRRDRRSWRRPGQAPSRPRRDVIEPDRPKRAAAARSPTPSMRSAQHVRHSPEPGSALMAAAVTAKRYW